MKVFENIPFLRIILPLLFGILLSIQFETLEINFWLIGLTLGIIFLLKFLSKQIAPLKRAVLLITDVFFIIYGVAIVNNSRITNNEFYYGNHINENTFNKLVVSVNDIPIEKENFVKCKLKVFQIISDSNKIDVKGDIIAYFRRSVKSDQLKAGQSLVINAKLNEVDPPKNPYEFDYRKYLKHKQILHTAFLDSTDFYSINERSILSSIWRFGLDVKSKVLQQLKISGLNMQAYSICSALLTGYDEEIDRSVIDSFSHSGTLHILSVSGLHTGLIYLLLAFLFQLADPKNRFKTLRLIIIIVCLWIFALITGFSAPVLRAVIMFSLFGVGKVFFRKDPRNQINILLVSAFILLNYDPYLITDIGFQLSYFALAGILCFQPFFSSFLQPTNKVGQYIWNSVSASFAATISTLPFTLFYFKQFPLWFFVCNLIIVPVSFIALILALFIAFNLFKLSGIVNLIVGFMIWFIDLFNFSGAGYIDHIDFNWLDSVLMSVIIIVISVAVYRRSYLNFVYALIIVITWQMNGLIDSYRAKNQDLFAVYHLKKQKAHLVKVNTKVSIDSISENLYNYHIKPHLITFNYPFIQTKSNNHIVSEKSDILVLDRNQKWPKIDFSKISIIVITNNFKLYENDLDEFAQLQMIVSDGSNNYSNVKHLAKLCSKFGIDFYNTKSKGALVMEL